ncbi:MAG: DUF2490 domain-containing protein, partial [Flavobacteriales bacterium]|nr:DUF2490 domain-containing protein [Flavobacteriales bacterium]
LCAPQSSLAQVDQGVLPRIGLSKKINPSFTLNSSIQSRASFYRHRTDSPPGLEHELLDWTSLLAYRTGPRSKVQIGYMLRFEDEDLIHRSIQRFSVVHEFLNGRLGHRIGTDQTFSSDESEEYRLRYRISWETALQGEQVDTREFYLVLSKEFFGKLQDQDTETELRLGAQLGYQLDSRWTLEAGPDYRWSDLRSPEAQIIWWSLNCYLEL